VDEGVERLDALFQARAQALPLGLCQHARDEVERDQPLGSPPSV
jgi:hypothetical protein